MWEIFEVLHFIFIPFYLLIYKHNNRFRIWQLVRVFLKLFWIHIKPALNSKLISNTARLKGALTTLRILIDRASLWIFLVLAYINLEILNNSKVKMIEK